MQDKKFVVEKVDNKHGIYVGERTSIAFDPTKHILTDRPAPNASCFFDLQKEIWTSEYFCPTSIKERRFNICKECENFNKTMKTCKICGCIMPIKVAFSNFSCPITKW